MFYENLDEFKNSSGYEINGFWYPRVTKIMEIKAKPALYYFYAEMKNFAAGEAVKNQSAAEGTLVHDTIEKILIGENPVIDPSIKPAVDAFMKFYSENNIIVDPSLVEKRIVNYDDRYAGTLDAMAVINGKFGVLDIKTSQSIYRDYNLQTSAYMAALDDEYNLQTRWILRIDQNKKCLKCGSTLRQKGGRDKIKASTTNYAKAKNCVHEWSELQGEIELKEFPQWTDDYKAFLGAKKLWEWENEYMLKRLGY